MSQGHVRSSLHLTGSQHLGVVRDAEREASRAFQSAYAGTPQRKALSLSTYLTIPINVKFCCLDFQSTLQITYKASAYLKEENMTLLTNLSFTDLKHKLNSSPGENESTQVGQLAIIPSDRTPHPYRERGSLLCLNLSHS